MDGGKDEVALTRLVMMGSSGAWPLSRVRTGNPRDGGSTGWDGLGSADEKPAQVAANVDKYPQFRKTLGLVEHGASQCEQGYTNAMAESHPSQDFVRRVTPREGRYGGGRRLGRAWHQGSSSRTHIYRGVGDNTRRNGVIHPQLAQVLRYREDTYHNAIISYLRDFLPP